MNHVRAFLMVAALVLAGLSCHLGDTPPTYSDFICDQEDIIVGYPVTFTVASVSDPDGDVTAVLIGQDETGPEVELAEMTAVGSSFTADYTFVEPGPWTVHARLTEGRAGVATTYVFRHVDADGVYILGVMWTPVEYEDVELKNGSLGEQDISGWTVGDTESPTAYSIPDGTVLQSKEHLVILGSEMGIEITEDDLIYLRDATGAEIDTWENPFPAGQ